MTTPDTTINRATIITVLTAIAPFLEKIDTEYMLFRVLGSDSDCSTTMAEMRELSKVFKDASYRDTTLAFLTIAVEEYLKNPIILIDAETESPNGAADSPRPEGEGQGVRALSFTHVERGESKGSGSPKWEFKNDEGERYWAFAHHKPERNTIPLFVEAGYTDLMDMQLGDVQRWQKHPITITAIKEDDFWKALSVEPKPEGAKPDSSLIDVITPAKRTALSAFQLFSSGKIDDKEIVIVDVETTGTTDKDEIVEFAGLNLATGEVYETLISTHDNERINAVTHLNGITEAMLDADSTPKFEYIALNIEDFLRDRIIVAHNREFEMRMLRQTWEQNERPYPVEWDIEQPTYCTMLLMSKLVSDPDYQGSPRWIGLDDARKLLGIEIGQTHRAMPDVRLTHAVIKAAALLYADSRHRTWTIFRSKD